MIKTNLAGFAGLHEHKAVAHKGNQRRKRKPSAHQKQIRFFIGLFITIIVLATILLICFANQRSFSHH